MYYLESAVVLFLVDRWLLIYFVVNHLYVTVSCSVFSG